MNFLGLEISDITCGNFLESIVNLGLHRKPGFSCFVNVHMLVESYDDSNFKENIENATFRLPDGMPIVKCIKWIYQKRIDRVDGMSIIEPLLDHMDRNAMRLYIFGGSDKLIQAAACKISRKYSSLVLCGFFSPPFRKWSFHEEDHWVRTIRDSSPHIVFVILGCPKQERFMARHFQSIPAHLLGLGGALPVFAEVQKRAPVWMQKLMLEWFYRLVQEPRRLWRRYFYTNLKFIFLIVRLLIYKLYTQ